jgi:3-oxoadipate enol-lactonase
VSGRLYHQIDGPEGAPVLVLSNSIGTTHELWDPQIEAFAERFRVLRYDQLGHGRSEVPPGPYTVEGLGDELLALLDKLGIERFSYCGLSLGGAVGQWLGATVPDRIERLVLAGTSAYFGPPERWIERAAFVRGGGLAEVAAGSMERWFTADFGGWVHWRDALAATPPEGYASCCDALALWDFRSELIGVSVPTLVIVGAQDPATTPADAELIADAIPGAKLVVVPGAAHLLNVEQPEAFTAAVLDHLVA